MFQIADAPPQAMNIGQIIVWIIVGGFAGTLAGRAVTWKRQGLGRWTNLVVGMAGAVIGGELFKLFRIDFGLGELKVTFEDLIAAFLGSLLVILLWRTIAKFKAKKTGNQHPKS
jgi:uncharacterized membrane protein YeaQ/YmgE (transglycosylase-associated protein family)